MVKKALYLAGGGARGAYQAGVLKAIDHILQVKAFPFSMVSGVSVGSINAIVLAENADDFPKAVEHLNYLWSEIHCQKIYNASNYELSKSVLRNFSTIMVKQRQSGHLLDTTPLKQFITEQFDFERINDNLHTTNLEMLEIITNCYDTQQTVSFYNYNKQTEFEDWHYPRHISQHTVLRPEHILASSALPLFFPNVKINEFHYGDGSIGLIAPLRGAIRFQVEEILILGTRQTPAFSSAEAMQNGEVGFAHILGSMLNGLFLDNLDRDIEMVNRMNEISRLLSIWRKRHSPWRPINTLHLRPSQSMAEVAQGQYYNLPTLLRFLLNILGAQQHSGDLLSFLLFEKEFTQQLIELGYKDTLAVASEVEDFFSR